MKELSEEVSDPMKEGVSVTDASPHGVVLVNQGTKLIYYEGVAV